MKTHAMQRSLEHLRETGWLATSVEKWIPVAGNWKKGKRVDAFGFGDILACRRIGLVSHQSNPPANFVTGWRQEIALVQTFPLARWNDHVEKLCGKVEGQEYIALNAEKWRKAGGLIIFHGWAYKVLRDSNGVRIKSKSGKSKYGWQLREELL